MFSISLDIVTDLNSSYDIRGNRIAFTISSPKIILLSFPPGVIPCLSHSFTPQRSTALNSSTSLTFNTSFFTIDLTTDLSTVANSSDVTALSVCFSITFQHRFSKSVSSNIRAHDKVQKTFDTFTWNACCTNCLQLKASSGVMYFFAKYHN